MSDLELSMEGIIIRPFASDDRNRVEAFFDQMVGESHALFDRGDGNRRLALRFFEEDLPGIERYMAVDGTRMIGYVFLWDLNTCIPSLGIAIAEDCKGRHLGRRLMQYAHDRARMLGKGGILLTTDFANLRGQALYERMGYERLGMSFLGSFQYLFRFRE